MANFGGAINAVVSEGGGVIGKVLFGVVIGLVILVPVIIGIVWYFKGRKWNLKVEFKLARNDGRLINAEWGKGSLDATKGVVIIKRKGCKAVSMKPFDIKKYLQGTEILTVVQIGPEQFKPILPRSFLYATDSETGDEGCILDIEVDTGSGKAWKNAFEESSLNAFTLSDFFTRYKEYFAFGFIMLTIFIGFAVLWSKV